MCPSNIFHQYQKNKINRSTAISTLKSYLENISIDEIRINALKYLGKLSPKSIESFKYFEQLLLSDSNELIRANAAEIIIKDYLKEGKKALKWIINNEKPIPYLIKIFKSLKSDNRKEAKLLISFMEQTLERRFSDLTINKREEIGLGRLERMMGKSQDDLLDLDDESFYLSKPQINNLLEDIKELIKHTKLEQIDHRYARLLRIIGHYYMELTQHYSPEEPYFDDYKKASIAYELSLKIDPDNEDVWLRLADAYRALKEFDKAIRIYKKALENNPPSINTGGSLASLYHLLGEYEEEKETYEYLLKHNPEEFSCWRELGKAFINCGEYHKAVVTFERYIEENPKYYKYQDLNELSYSYRKLGDLNKAEEMVNRVLKHRFYKGKDIPTLTNLLLIYQEKGNLDKKNELYNEIMELELRSLKDKIDLVELHIEMNLFEKAREIITSIKEDRQYKSLEEEYPDSKQYFDRRIERLRKKIGLKLLNI